MKIKRWDDPYCTYKKIVFLGDFFISVSKVNTQKGNFFTVVYSSRYNRITRSGFSMRESFDAVRFELAKRTNPDIMKTIERLDSAKGDGDNRGRGSRGLRSTAIIIDELSSTSGSNPIWDNISKGLKK